MRIYQCDICRATYSSASHLRRHEAVHAGQRHFSCHFCNQRFFRGDVARRHSRTCPSKGDLPLPEPKQRGKKRQACDACAQAKRACDQQRPCEGCRLHSLNCAYDRIENLDVSSSSLTPSKDSLSTPTLEHEPVDWSSLDMPSQLSSGTHEKDIASGNKSGKIPINFLLNFTKPNKETIQDFFGNPAPSPLAGDPSPKAYLNPATEVPTLSMEFGFWDELMHPEILQPLSEQWWRPTSELEPQPTNFSEPHNPVLHSRVVELISHLAKAQNSLPEEMHRPSPELLDVMFTVANVGHFVQTYFDYWYPHCPILHRPSFNSETVSLPLLLTVLLIGAIYSSPRDTSSMALQFYDLAEEYVFEHIEFRQIIHKEHANAVQCSNSSIEALQAAFNISIMQNWGGSVLSRRRMRVKRYSDIVAAARIIQLPKTTNSFFNKDQPSMDPFDWDIFIQEEARVRLMSYIFLVDCQYTIFYRHPPRLMLIEMSGHPPCREEVYSAKDSAHCNLLAIKEQNSRPPSIASFMEALMEDSPEVGHDNYFGTLTTLHLFIIINAFCNLVFLLKKNCLGPYIIPRIQRGLARWKKLWDAHLPHINNEGSFTKNSPEFWQLANILLVELGPKENAHQGILTECDADSMNELNILLQKFSM